MQAGKRRDAVVQRVCFTLQIDRARLHEYRARHEAVWPELRAALSEAGWQNYSLFLRDDGLVIGYLECEDFEAAVSAMQSKPVNERWQAEMREFFVDLSGAAPDTAARPLPEVFHLA